MTVFQYCGSIYYRAFRHIPSGRELLVWYDQKYSEFLDIPALMKARGVKGKVSTIDAWGWSVLKQHFWNVFFSNTLNKRRTMNSYIA